jgi:peptidoglycan/xylan/chitin deacetylase (PgdA/CDA1 family)/ketosteroid isomerase-like protein
MIPLAAWLLLAAPAPTPAPEPPRPIVVTVDDLPVASLRWHATPAARATVTRGLLKALAKHHIKAVGLVVGQNVATKDDEALLDLWLKQGHELGNHSFRHLIYTDMEPEPYIADVEKERAALAAFLSARQASLRFFRFPFLREGDTPAKLEAMRAYLRDSGQRNLPVTIDDQDWSFEDPWMQAVQARDERRQREVGDDYLAALRLAVHRHERRSDRLFKRVVPQILLLHANAVGAAHWDALFTWLEASGHRFVTIDEALADAAYQEPQDYVGAFGFGLWDRIAVVRRARETQADVAALLARQAEAWNAGDLDGFCAAYAEDASLATPAGLLQGRAAVLERYRSSYAEASTRGRLAFEIVELRRAEGVEFTAAGDVLPSRLHGASVLARWTLVHDGGATETGLSLLVLRPKEDGWEIVQDASL